MMTTFLSARIRAYALYHPERIIIEKRNLVMSKEVKTTLDQIDLNTDAILLKADGSDDMLTYQSSLSGNAYIIDRNGGVMILDRHGFYRAQANDLQVICEELRAWILPEVERWMKT